jgi:hypothetical protein
MKPSAWRAVRLDWTWAEVAWILAHGGRAALEHVIAYGRDVWDLGENPTPPLVAWAVDKWLEEHEGKPTRKPIKRGPPEL